MVTHTHTHTQDDTTLAAGEYLYGRSGYGTYPLGFTHNNCVEAGALRGFTCRGSARALLAPRPRAAALGDGGVIEARV